MTTKDQNAVIAAMTTKAIFAMSMIAEIHQHAATTFNETIGAILETYGAIDSKKEPRR